MPFFGQILATLPIVCQIFLVLPQKNLTPFLGLTQHLKMRRITSKQKRAGYKTKRGAKRASGHLWLGDLHDIDRKAAERLRSFPTVPRLKQAPFPRAREVGFAGHWLGGKLVKQATEEDFCWLNLRAKKDCWYWRKDKRPGRKPRKTETGLVEVNVALSSGLARELARIVEDGSLKAARRIIDIAVESGAAELVKRTGYTPCYVAVHPDSEGTLSFHFGMWPVDVKKRCLLGRSADGKRGRKGLRTLGDAFFSILRHHQAIRLPDELVRLALHNLRQRNPDDWATGKTMDKVVREELGRGPEGVKALARVDEYQREAARDWLARYQAGALGVQKLDARLKEAEMKLARRRRATERLVARKQRVIERQASRMGELAKENAGLRAMVRMFFEKVLAVPGLVSLVREAGQEIWNVLVDLGRGLGLEVPRPTGPSMAALREENNTLRAHVRSLEGDALAVSGELEKLEVSETRSRELEEKNKVLRTKVWTLTNKNLQLEKTVAQMNKGKGPDKD